jgi:phage terminase large subunit-like protein
MSTATTMPDPVTFIERTLVNYETGRLFKLTEAEKAFLAHAFELQGGRLAYPELVFSAPKKSGKTAFAAMVTIYMVRVVGGRFAEGICCANDYEQATGRVFQAISRIVEASPMLRDDATITQGKITFNSTGATITALSSNYASAAGANPTIVVFDELWAYTSESAHRLWDELVPPPTRKLAARLVVTYAGFEGESELLQSLQTRGHKGTQIAPDLYAQSGMLMYWTHSLTAPWQTPEWLEEMRATMRTSAFIRQIENRFVTSESTFIDLAWWDACVDPAHRPSAADQRLPVWVGVDASVKRDSTAIVACTWHDNKAHLITHKIFQPTPHDPLDFEATIESTLLEMCKRFRVKEVRYDPYQMAAVAQRLLKRRVPMVEYPQSVPNITEASQNLYELIKAGNIIVYPDAPMRLAVQRAVAIEGSRGWKISKEKSSHKIDVVVALGMAALGAVQGGVTHRVMPKPNAVLMQKIMRPSFIDAGRISRTRLTQLEGRGGSPMKAYFGGDNDF